MGLFRVAICGILQLWKLSYFSFSTSVNFLLYRRFILWISFPGCVNFHCSAHDDSISCEQSFVQSLWFAVFRFADVYYTVTFRCSSSFTVSQIWNLNFP